MNLARTAPILVGILAACSGGDKKNNPPTPDAFVIHDSSPDARTCGTLTPTDGTVDFVDANLTAQTPYAEWGGNVTGALGTVMPTIIQYEFYGGIESSLSGTFDLHAGMQANYATCAICVRAFEVDDQGQVTHQYFQSGGSVTLTEDPLTNTHMIASFSNLQLEEVTVDQNTYTSTPVPGGACADLAQYSVDHDKVPNAYTCAHTTWQDGATCNCMCGISDPDCTIANAPVAGCTTTGDVCFNTACVTPPANDTCTAAATLTVGTPVTGSTAGAKNDYSAGLNGATCTGYSQPGPDVAYKVHLLANTNYTFTLSNLATTYDASFALVGPGADTNCTANPITTCVAGADAALDGANETFMYMPTADGDYFVIVDGYTSTEGGTFTLSATAN
jgi:hypothetical protein